MKTQIFSNAERWFDMQSQSFRNQFSTLTALLALVLILSGCSTPTSESFSSTPAPTTGALQPEPLVLREGDLIKIEFPGAPNLNTRESIKRDGKISLLVGQVEAAGKTVEQLQKEILDLYAPQLVTKLVVVSVESSTFSIYITGAVGKGGKMTFDKPVTALEAVLEAGVNLAGANLKAVRLTRTSGGRTEVTMLNLDKALRGKDPNAKPIYLREGDILYVPEKFQWF